MQTLIPHMRYSRQHIPAVIDYYNCDMGHMGDRIKARRDELGLSQEALAKKAGIGQSTISALEKHRNPGSSYVAQIAEVLKVSAKWLATGRGSRDPTNITVARPDVREVPLIDYVQAGRGRVPSDPYPIGGDNEMLLTDVPVGDNAFALTIKGDSMQPDFKPGDKIIVDPAVQPQPGDYVVAKIATENEVTFKRYRLRGIDASGREVFELTPLNEDFETIRSDETPCSVIGTMVEHRRFRKR